VKISDKCNIEFQDLHIQSALPGFPLRKRVGLHTTPFSRLFVHKTTGHSKQASNKKGPAKQTPSQQNFLLRHNSYKAIITFLGSFWAGSLHGISMSALCISIDF